MRSRGEGRPRLVNRLPHGLQRYQSLLHPSVVADIEGWRDEPDLAALHASLHAHQKRKVFFDALAEAMVARHLKSRGCALRFEVPTPSGKHCDFRVDAGDLRFFLHIKRLETDRPQQVNLPLSSRLRVLERIRRPYVVGVRWQAGLDDEAMQDFVTRASQFIGQARVGEEQVVHDAAGAELGGVRIIAPGEGAHVNLVIGLPTGFIDDTPRMFKLLRKAYPQFMPKALNVILICSAFEEDRDDFESALLGEHEERWDRHPPRGRRIAYGRAADGFWHGTRRSDSRIAGWFRFDPASDQFRSTLWYRQGFELDSRARETLNALFSDGDA